MYTLTISGVGAHLQSAQPPPSLPPSLPPSQASDVLVYSTSEVTPALISHVEVTPVGVCVCVCLGEILQFLL